MKMEKGEILEDDAYASKVDGCVKDSSVEVIGLAGITDWMENEKDSVNKHKVIDAWRGTLRVIVLRNRKSAFSSKRYALLKSFSKHVRIAIILDLTANVNTIMFTFHKNMTTNSKLDPNYGDTEKKLIARPEVTNVADVQPTDSNKIIEVIMYRKWTSKHNKTHQPTR
ncbi:hypothetical protein Tco_1381415 [Tanacetum coccineum]